MYSTLIVARMAPDHSENVAGLFADLDRTELPHLMGTRRRELFSYRGLYFHLQDFEQDGAETIQGHRQHPRFVQISQDLKEHIEAYDPLTWQSPKDAMATRFYHWSAA